MELGFISRGCLPNVFTAYFYPTIQVLSIFTRNLRWKFKDSFKSFAGFCSEILNFPFKKRNIPILTFPGSQGFPSFVHLIAIWLFKFNVHLFTKKITDTPTNLPETYLLYKNLNLKEKTNLLSRISWKNFINF